MIDFYIKADSKSYLIELIKVALSSGWKTNENLSEELKFDCLFFEKTNNEGVTVNAFGCANSEASKELHYFPSQLEKILGLLRIAPKPPSIDTSDYPSLDKLRKSQNRDERFESSPQSEFTKAYWNHVRSISNSINNVAFTDVESQFKACIKIHEEKKGTKWHNSHPAQTDKIINNLFELLNGKTNKSLLLNGKRGTGKTTIMRCFYMPAYQILKRGNYLYTISANEILLKESELIHSSSYDHCLIDDLGTEINHAKINGSFMPSKEDIANNVFYILDKRRVSEKITHVTTNLDTEQLIKVYGERISWRFDEMFEFVNF